MLPVFGAACGPGEGMHALEMTAYGPSLRSSRLVCLSPGNSTSQDRHIDTPPSYCDTRANPPRPFPFSSAPLPRCAFAPFRYAAHDTWTFDSFLPHSSRTYRLSACTLLPSVPCIPSHLARGDLQQKKSARMRALSPLALLPLAAKREAWRRDAGRGEGEFYRDAKEVDDASEGGQQEHEATAGTEREAREGERSDGSPTREAKGVWNESGEVKRGCPRRPSFVRLFPARA